MARKMKKFSAGGAQGRYDRRMADIEKDYAKAAARKTGKAAEVAEAKRQQRIADAKDDLAKRTGADRTATRAAERTAESNLTKTRKYGAPKAVTTEASVSEPKVATVSAPLKSDLSSPASKPAAKPVQKSVQKPAAAKLRDRYYVSPENRRAIDEAAKKEPFTKTDSRALADLKAMQAKRNADSEARLAAARKVRGGSNFGAATTSKDASAALLAPKGSTSRSGSLFGDMFKTSDAYRKSQEAKYGKAKGGKINKEKTMKYAKGGSTASQPVPPKKKPKEPITGGADTVPLTPERKEFLKELAKRNAKPGMAKGGKATKFGAAMVKKSADTKGRAMVKKAGGGKCYASGGSVSSASKRADGCATKGKTKGTMLARGGAAQMRSRDSYGGANFKKGGSC
jgi:hypothetical protein